MKLNWIFSHSIGFSYLKTNGFEKRLNPYAGMARSAVLKRFWTRPKSEFGEQIPTQASNNVWKNGLSGWILAASC